MPMHNLRVDSLSTLPVGTSILTPDQSARIFKIWEQLQRFPGLQLGDGAANLAGFESGFTQDLHPEAEIRLWEELAARLRNLKKPSLEKANRAFRNWLFHSVRAHPLVVYMKREPREEGPEEEHER